MRQPSESGRAVSGARALVLAAILFCPDGASAGVPAGAAKDGEAPPPAAPIDEATRRYCEEWRASCNPRSRAGCFPEERCRVWEAERRAREGSGTPAE